MALRAASPPSPNGPAAVRAQDRPPATALVELKQRLHERSRRLTGARHAILEVLRGPCSPLSAREIRAALPAEQCDLATVYRSLHLLEELGLVQRFELGDGRTRFELLPEGKHRHHHHLVCTSCATVIPIDDCFPPEFERQIASRNGFKSLTHRLDFFGVCPNCQ